MSAFILAACADTTEPKVADPAPVAASSEAAMDPPLPEDDNDD